MNILKSLLWAGAMAGPLLLAAHLQATTPTRLNQQFADLQQQYLQGHLSARQYEQLKSQALQQRLGQIQQSYNRGDISEPESLRLTDVARRQYAAAYSPLPPDQKQRLQAASEHAPTQAARSPGVLPEQSDLSILNAQAVDQLQRLYFQGRISANQYEQIKLRAKEQVAAEIDRRYYQGQLSADEARTLHHRLDQDYARLYSPLTHRELAELQATFPPIYQSTLPEPTGTPTGRTYAAPPAESKTQLLDDLLDRYRQDKITPHQYQEERARILALPQP